MIFYTAMQATTRCTATPACSRQRVGFGSGLIENPIGNTWFDTALDHHERFHPLTRSGYRKFNDDRAHYDLHHDSASAPFPRHFSHLLESNSRIVVDVDPPRRTSIRFLLLYDSEGNPLAFSNDDSAIDPGSDLDYPGFTLDSFLTIEAVKGGTNYFDIEDTAIILTSQRRFVRDKRFGDQPPIDGTDGAAGNDQLLGGLGNDLMFGGAAMRAKRWSRRRRLEWRYGDDVLTGEAPRRFRIRLWFMDTTLLRISASSERQRIHSTWWPLDSQTSLMSLRLQQTRPPELSSLWELMRSRCSA
jgi:hypothetical protein